MITLESQLFAANRFHRNADMRQTIETLKDLISLRDWCLRVNLADEGFNDELADRLVKILRLETIQSTIFRNKENPVQ